MKLLIVTQVMDKNHPVLGFFHRWIEEFAKSCEQVHVICLEEGEHDLPKNVAIYSLGKDIEKVSAFLYAARLQKISWKLRKEYDAVFVHMIPGYVIAGFPVWKFLRKKIGLWYTHGSVSCSLRLSERFVNIIFTAAKEGCNIKSKKVYITGHGIDVSVQAPKADKKDIDMITVGRIAPSKNLEALIDVLVSIKKTKPDTNFTIVGSPLTEEEKQYKDTLDRYISKRGMTDSVNFIGTILNSELPKLFIRSKVFVHAATNGSLDKALLEPLAIGLPVITSASGARSLPLENWLVSDTAELADRVTEVLNNDVSRQAQKLHLYIQENHSILSLIPKICKYYNS